jgi:hypothetical protein
MNNTMPMNSLKRAEKRSKVNTHIWYREFPEVQLVVSADSKDQSTGVNIHESQDAGNMATRRRPGLGVGRQ